MSWRASNLHADVYYFLLLHSKGNSFIILIMFNHFSYSIISALAGKPRPPRPVLPPKPVGKCGE